jgi:hypothetical protein
MRLNGWRRLGVVLSLAWWLVVVTMIVHYAYTVREEAKFWERKWGQRDSTATPAPSTRGVVDPFEEERTATAATPGKPWERDWGTKPPKPSCSVNWGENLVVLAIPLAIWGMIELLVKAIRWVIKGFRPT